LFLLLQIASVFFVAIAMALSLAHALELPGKLRLDKETYLAVQPIYYPGFTIGGGVGEGLGIIATLALLLATDSATPSFYWTLVGLIALVASHATYWILTHPVNNFWLRGQDLKGLGARFFAVDPLKRNVSDDVSPDLVWTSFRNRWEYSHVVRAVWAAIALLALIVAIAI
jgi:hypothetical protein